MCQGAAPLAGLLKVKTPSFNPEVFWTSFKELIWNTYVFPSICVYIYTSLYYNILYLLYIYIYVLYIHITCVVSLLDFFCGITKGEAARLRLRARWIAGLPKLWGHGFHLVRWDGETLTHHGNTNGIPIEIMQPMVLEYLPIHLPQKSTSFVGKYSSTSIWVYNLSIFITFYCRNQPVLHEMGTCFFFFGFIGS